MDDGALDAKDVGRQRHGPNEARPELDGREADVRVEHRLHRRAHRRVEDGGDDAAVDRAERAVVLLTGLVLERDPARHHVGAAQPDQVGDRRGGNESGGLAVQELEAGQPVAERGALDGVVPGDRAGAAHRASSR